VPKNVLILASSPRKGGNSDLLCEQFMLGARESGHTTEMICLRDKKINYCTGCGMCFDRNGQCSQKDDMTEVLEKMVGADVLVFATPVYFYAMCGQMKTLIDRTCPRYTELSDKEFHFIMTAADDDSGAMKTTLEEFRAFLSCLDNPVEKSVIYGIGAWKIGDILNSATMQQAYQAGKSI